MLLVTPAKGFVNAPDELTCHVEARAFCGSKLTLLPWWSTTMLGPVAATLGLRVPSQSKRQAISAKSPTLAITFDLRLI